jgi:hypothetical protein
MKKNAVEEYEVATHHPYVEISETVAKNFA